jgi:hypothetical protein
MTGASAAFMPAVGSSNMKTCGSSAISSATSSLRWSPCGRLATSGVLLRPSARSAQGSRRPARSMPWSLQMLHRLSPRRCAPSRVACTARRTFSSTVRFGNRFVSWKARPRPAWVRAEADSRRQVAPIERHRARARPELPRDQVEVGRLARPVRPDDGRQRARREGAADAVDGHVAAEADGQSAGFQHRWLLQMEKRMAIRPQQVPIT